MPAAESGIVMSLKNLHAADAVESSRIVNHLEGREKKPGTNANIMPEIISRGIWIMLPPLFRGSVLLNHGEIYHT